MVFFSAPDVVLLTLLSFLINLILYICHNKMGLKLPVIPCSLTSDVKGAGSFCLGGGLAPRVLSSRAPPQHSLLMCWCESTTWSQRHVGRLLVGSSLSEQQASRVSDPFGRLEKRTEDTKVTVV